ncbi:hypothetical protein HK102_010558 [Quaeritorhiza haematococci]|nr:hypothetical protein HK102_010558 [Quaeritorhiza haematococci]
MAVIRTIANRRLVSSLSNVRRGALATSLQQKRNLITIIPQGTEAYRLSFGANPQLLGPGIHLKIPIYHEVRKVDLREGSRPINALEAFTKDNVPVSLSGSLFYRVVDSYKACFNVQDPIDSIENLGTSAMRSIVGLFEYDEIIADRHILNEQLRATIGKSSEPWGVECTRFEIQHFTPSNQEIKTILEKQMDAERSRRKQILDTEANVNVAEGVKRKTILESEGSLMASKNHAEGAFFTAKKEGDAKRYMLEQESLAIKSQVEEIAKVLDGDSKTAAHVLLELKRIEQLRAIAEGKNNTVYFLDTTNPALSSKELASLDFVVRKNVAAQN